MKKQISEKLKSLTSNRKAFLSLLIAVLALLFLILLLTVFGVKTAAPEESSDSTMEEVIATENDVDSEDIRISVVNNNKQGGQFFADELETDEYGRVYVVPRSVGQEEVNAAIASRALAKAQAEAESQSIEESEKASSEEESRSIEESQKEEEEKKRREEKASSETESDETEESGTESAAETESTENTDEGN